MSFAIGDKIYKRFQKEDTLGILLRMMRLLEIEITPTCVWQIIIVDLKYNAFSSDQAEKRISWIRQTNKSIAHIFVYTDIKIKQKIKKSNNKNQQVQNITMRKTYIIAMWYKYMSYVLTQIVKTECKVMLNQIYNINI